MLESTKKPPKQYQCETKSWDSMEVKRAFRGLEVATLTTQIWTLETKWWLTVKSNAGSRDMWLTQGCSQPLWKSQSEVILFLLISFSQVSDFGSHDGHGLGGDMASTSHCLPSQGAQ